MAGEQFSCTDTQLVRKTPRGCWKTPNSGYWERKPQNTKLQIPRGECNQIIFQPKFLNLIRSWFLWGFKSPMNQGWVTQLLLLSLWLFRRGLIFSIKHGLHSSRCYTFLRIRHPVYRDTEVLPSILSHGGTEAKPFSALGQRAKPVRSPPAWSHLLSPSCCAFCWQAMHFFLTSKIHSHIFFIFYLFQNIQG